MTQRLGDAPIEQEYRDQMIALVRPVFAGPVIVNGWKDSRPNDDVATFSF